MIIPDEFRRDVCYMGIAIIYKNEQYCEKITGKEFGGLDNPKKDECYFSVAEKKNDTSLCMKIKSSTAGYSQPDCYANIAIRTNDINLCYAAVGELRQKCIEIIANKTGNKINDETKELSNDDAYKNAVARIIRVSGETFVIIANKKDRIPAHVGILLNKGDIIKTGKTGSVTIEYLKNNEHDKLDPNSELLIIEK